MRIGILDNKSRKVLPTLTKAVEASKQARFAVAFVSKGGLDLVSHALETCLSHGGKAEFLVGLDLTTSEPEAVWSMYELCRKKHGVAMYCYANLERSSVYHPKLYLMHSGEEATAIVGSSNLTEGGLKRNVEINTLIQASIDEEIVSDLFDVYDKLKFHPKRVEPDEEFLSLYEKFCHSRRTASRSISKTPEDKRLKREFRDKMATLRHPVATKKDLLGWRKVIYSKLPQGDFSNNDIYAFEDEFRQRYPENRYVRPKIRQQLQMLAKMGLIEHVGTAKWRKP